MTGFYLNIIIGFVIAAALFGGALAAVFWLYRLSFGHPLRLPSPNFASAGGTILTLALGAALVGGLLWVFSLARADYAFWDSYTLPKYQAVDYVIRWLVVMPSLFWFGGSLLDSRKAEAVYEEEDFAEDEADDAAEDAPAEEPGSGS